MIEEVRQRAWKQAIGIAAGLAIRDHGASAYVVATDNAHQSRDLGNDDGVRFWTAVALEIADRQPASVR